MRHILDALTYPLSGDGTLSVMDVRSKKPEPIAQSEDQEDELLSIVPIKGYVAALPSSSYTPIHKYAEARSSPSAPNWVSSPSSTGAAGGAIASTASPGTRTPSTRSRRSLQPTPRRRPRSSRAPLMACSARCSSSRRSSSASSRTTGSSP